ncbi:glycoside hydrolase family 92 protein [Winogradskyella maritima]|nr:glycoside hydrolase family 92 protein [Winogradskyella maritima]
MSYVSIENARENLKVETEGKDFETLLAEAQEKWNKQLSTIEVEGGTEEDKSIFYTALYHTQIHPSTLNDANGNILKCKPGKP